MKYLTAEAAELIEPLRKCYRYEGKGKKLWMNECLLSPRGIFCKKGSKRGFVTCKDCKDDISNKRMPIHAISNGFYFGTPPQELIELTEAELAIMSPTSYYGYCFTYIGGRNMKLKGTLGYFKVKTEAIVRCSLAANALAKYLNREVVVILNGKMTEKQRKRAVEKSKIRPDKVVAAIKWLVENNEEWRNIDIDAMEENILKSHPIIVDDSVLVDSGSDTAIEEHDSFSVYFPDGTMTEVYGGKKSASDFKQIVSEAANKGFDGEILSNMSREFVRDYENNTFVSSCILQMPFGRGGCKEMRFERDGITASKWNLNEQAQHMSLISQPAFHRPLFVLKLFNSYLRSNILRSASQQLYSKLVVCNLHDTINSDDFQLAARAHGEGRSAGTLASQQLVRSIEAINKSLPHSNGAVNRARQFMEVLQQQFGLGGIFLTVTPDDENSFLVVAYSQTNMNGKHIDVSTLSAEVLEKNAKKRAELRLQYPGITALNFEYILDIVIEEVIGWNMKKGEPRERPGLFGKARAFGGAVEEQGRTSLHVHFIVWLEGWDVYLENVTHQQKRVRDVAVAVVRKVVDNSLSTRFMTFNKDGGNHDAKLTFAFDHVCKEHNIKKRKRPCVVGQQQLRNLRHKDCHLEDLTFAYCADCKTTWTNEDLVLDYLSKREQIPIVHYPDKSKYLDQVCFESTKPLPGQEVEKVCIHARYNNHRSTHCKSCFKRNPNLPFSDECRMRLPALPNKSTTVEKLPLTENGDNIIPWYTWRGVELSKEIVQVVPARGEYDLFQNTSCYPISESKIGGNTNGRVITPSPIGFYTVKYPTKGNQKEEAEPYENVVQSLPKALECEINQPDATERQKSLRLVIRAGFAHNKTNIVGSSMASFLTRRHSRFLFSHQFAYIPVPNLLSTIQEGTIQYANIKSHFGHRYAVSLSLHYLCRPNVLHDLSPYQFFTTYETINLTNKNKDDDDILCFEDNIFFSHPSHITEKSGVMKKLTGLRERHTVRFPWFLQSKFPDTATFQADILTCQDEDICEEMETYASMVLCLCFNYFCNEDILLDGSYVKKLRHVERDGKLKQYERFLQNLQDSRANYSRVRPTHDHLQRHTSPFDSDKVSDDTDDKIEDETDSADCALQRFDLNDFLDELDTQIEKSTNRHQLERGVSTERFVPPTFNCTTNRNKGSFRCGSQNLCYITEQDIIVDGIECTFVREQTNAQALLAAPSSPPTPDIPARVIPNRDEILNIIFCRNAFVTKIIKFANEEKEQVFPEANGSGISIVTWGRLAGFDANQQTAFEIFASSFVLTFFNDASQRHGHNTRNVDFNKAKLQLMKLSRRVKTSSNNLPRDVNGNKNLISFLHGPGGSGKTAIMSILLLYAADYCGFVGETFNSHTIISTALSGVAATMIPNGRTTHSALYMNSKPKNIPSEEIERWRCTRLVIVDEISFAKRTDVQTMESRLRVLKDAATRFYGGVDIIFCGDFRQLEPVNAGDNTIYMTKFFEWHTMVHCYIELHGMHRFKNDMEWGHLLTRMRDGRMTETDIDTINKRVIHSEKEIPRDMCYATYGNKDRTAINIGLFESYCKRSDGDDNGVDVPRDDAVIIFASALKVMNGSKTYTSKDNVWDAWFFENCSEGDITPNGYYGRFDPALMLYYHRPVMVNKNVAVGKGIANGTRCYLSQVCLHPGEQASSVIVNGRSVLAVRTSQVDRITLQHDAGAGEPSSYFDVKPENHCFRAKVPIPTALAESSRRVKRNKTEILLMKGIQFPIICNNATTGHKLQGASVKQLFVHTWTSCKNWEYVVLS